MYSVLAVDQGTTATKTVLLNSRDEITLVANSPHEQIYPQQGWVEHNPEEILQNIIEGIRAGCEIADEPIAGIGIANQGETVVAWDAESGEPVYNAIVWQDNRTEARTAQLKAEGCEALTLERAGLPLDPYFSASKLSWILQRVPRAKRLLRSGRLRFGTTDAFFLDRLAGVYLTDASTASRTSLMNLEAAKWDQELCDLFGIPIDMLPEIRPTAGIFGVASEFSVPIVASVVDQPAALFGHGCTRKGETKITFGTGAFALANTGSDIVRRPDKGILPTLAWQLDSSSISYALDAGLYNAGSAINWLLGTSLADSLKSLNRFKGRSAASRGLFFVPALSGLGFPYWDRSASSIWLGMNLDTSREDLCRAVVEGIALLAGRLVDELSEVAAIPGTLLVDGGLCNNPYFCQFFTDVVQREIRVPEILEITAYGTAKMAVIGSAIDSELSDVSGSFNSKAASVYHPASCMDDEKARFLDAVERCRNWNPAKE